MATLKAPSFQPNPEPGLYHKDIGFPKTFNPPSDVIPLDYSHHALVRAKAKKIGALPVRIDPTLCDIIEVEMNAMGKAIKCLFRMQWGRNTSLILAVALDHPKPVVKTAYLNDDWDSHKTLDSTRYLVPA